MGTNSGARMHAIFRALRRSTGIPWLLKIGFPQDEAAPIASPLEGEVGSLTVVTDTGNNISVLGGKMIFAATVGVGDPLILSTDSFVRNIGLTGFGKIKWIGRAYIGFEDNNANVPTHAAFAVISGTAVIYYDNGMSVTAGFSKSGAVEYETAIVNRGVGSFGLIRGGVFSEWTILGVGRSSIGDPLHYGSAARLTSSNYDDFNVVEMGAPFNTAFGLSMDHKSGVISAGDTFTTSSPNNAVDGDAWHTLKVTVIPSALFTDYLIRYQDATHNWIVRIDSAGSIFLVEDDAGETIRGSAIGVLAGGETVTVISINENIEIRYGLTVAFSYAGAVNFKTETTAKLNVLGTGSVVEDLEITPIELAGPALAEIEVYV